MTEVWRSIPDTYYEVSSLGNVRRVLPLKPMKSKQGYIVCGFRRGASYNHKKFVHHLVAEAFIGPRPEGKFINHKDGVKTNNTPENLEYVSRQENSAHAAKMGLYRSGDKHPKTTLTKKQRRTLLAQYKTGRYTQIYLAKEYGVSKATISRFLKGVTYSSPRP